jgi:hypothetical protein
LDEAKPLAKDAFIKIIPHLTEVGPDFHWVFAVACQRAIEVVEKCGDTATADQWRLEYADLLSRLEPKQ